MHDQAVYKQNKALPYGCRTCRTLNLQHATINGVVDTLMSMIYTEEEGGDYLVVLDVAREAMGSDRYGQMSVDYN